MTTTTEKRMQALRKFRPTTADGVWQYALHLIDIHLFFAASCCLRVLLATVTDEPSKQKVSALLAQCGIATASPNLMNLVPRSETRLAHIVDIMQDTDAQLKHVVECNACAIAPDPPDWWTAQIPVSDETHIVICAGGESLLTQLWCNLDSLCNTGCTMPVTIAHAAEISEAERQAFVRKFGCHLELNFLDLSQCPTGNAKTATGLRGYQIKLAAIVEFAAPRVLMCDADILWVTNPQHLVDSVVSHGSEACIMPDIWHMQTKRHDKSATTSFLYGLFGVNSDVRERESGLVYLNRERNWRCVSVLRHMLLEHEYYFDFGFGDKDLYSIAFHLTKTKVYPAEHPPVLIGTIEHPDGPATPPQFISHAMMQRLNADAPISHVHTTLHPLSERIETAGVVPTHSCDVDDIAFARQRTRSGATVNTIACDVCDARTLAVDYAPQQVYRAAHRAIRDLDALKLWTSNIIATK